MELRPGRQCAVDESEEEEVSTDEVAAKAKTEGDGVTTALPGRAVDSEWQHCGWCLCCIHYVAYRCPECFLLLLCRGVAASCAHVVSAVSPCAAPSACPSACAPQRSQCEMDSSSPSLSDATTEGLASASTTWTHAKHVRHTVSSQVHADHARSAQCPHGGQWY